VIVVNSQQNIRVFFFQPFLNGFGSFTSRYWHDSLKWQLRRVTVLRVFFEPVFVLSQKIFSIVIGVSDSRMSIVYLLDNPISHPNFIWY
jgi:hypothetical protein